MTSLFLFITLLCGSPSAHAADAAKLTLVVQQNYEEVPIVVELKDFIRTALASEHIAVTYSSFPLGRGTASVSKGEVDGEMIRDGSVVEQFPNLIKTVNPLVFSDVKVIYLKRNKKYSYANLKKLTAGVLLNNKVVIDKVKKDDFKYIEVQGPGQAFNLLEQGRIDYFLIVDQVAFDLFESSKDLPEKFAIDSEAYQRLNLYLVLNKKHSALMPKIEKALRTYLKNDMAKYKKLSHIANKNF